MVSAGEDGIVITAPDNASAEQLSESLMGGKLCNISFILTPVYT